MDAIPDDAKLRLADSRSRRVSRRLELFRLFHVAGEITMHPKSGASKYKHTSWYYFRISALDGVFEKDKASGFPRCGISSTGSTSAMAFLQGSK